MLSHLQVLRYQLTENQQETRIFPLRIILKYKFELTAGQTLATPKIILYSRRVNKIVKKKKYIKLSIYLIGTYFRGFLISRSWRDSISRCFTFAISIGNYEKGALKFAI